MAKVRVSGFSLRKAKQARVQMGVIEADRDEVG